MLAKGLCTACYMRSRKATPRTGPVKRYKYMPEIPETDYSVPARTPGVRQNAVTAFPLEHCPHCRGHWIEYDGREAHCPGAYGGCGATTYLIKEAIS